MEILHSCTKPSLCTQTWWKLWDLLSDQRTSKHVENLGFTGPPKVLPDLIFFAIEIPHREAPWGIFLTDSPTATMRVFIGPLLFLSVAERGPVDLAMSVYNHITQFGHPSLLCQFHSVNYNKGLGFSALTPCPWGKVTVGDCLGKSLPSNRLTLNCLSQEYIFCNSFHSHQRISEQHQSTARLQAENARLWAIINKKMQHVRVWYLDIWLVGRAGHHLAWQLFPLVVGNKTTAWECSGWERE